MAYHFSETSKKRIALLHPDLQYILHEAIKITDFSVITGLRNEVDQEKACNHKPPRSNARYPHSRHNRSKQNDGIYDYTMSDAFDIAPYPIKWPDVQKQTTKEYIKRMGAFYLLAGIIISIAHAKDIKIRWGGHFKSIFDAPHFERIV